MKNILNKLILLMISVVLISSCNESSFLDLKNPNLETEAIYWTKESNAYSALATVYSALHRHMYGYYGAHTGIQMQNVRADDTWTIVGEDNSVWIVSTFTDAPSNKMNYEAIYEPMYVGINRANVFLANIEKTPMDEAKKKIWIGEVKFLRGFMYFQLVKEYQMAPILTVPAGSDPDNMMKPSSSEAELWAQVESDLKDAREALPVTREAGEEGRITKGAAIAMLGKAYIYQSKYSEGESELKTILTAPYAYDLVENPDDNFTEFTENNKESVFELMYDGTFGGGGLWSHDGDNESMGNVISNFVGPEGTGGWFKIMPSASLVEAFVTEKRPANSDTKFDKRMYTSFYFKHSEYGDVKPDETWYGGMSFDDIWLKCSEKRGKGEPDFPLIDGVKGRFLMKKFTNFYLDEPDMNSMYNITKTGNNNLRAMRFAEVLLLHAEACIKNGNLTDAAADITRIRDRAGLPKKTWANADELWKEMEHQKYLELFFEGQRFYDLRRWYSFEDMKAILQKNKKQGADNMQPKHFYYPIPQNELNSNTAIEQHPLWR